jgi:uncharacterized integral membrane protein (TIGR00698 family)
MPQAILKKLRLLFPGLLVVVVIALASRFVAEHYGAPAMLLALLFGIALNFLGSEARSRPGIDFGSRSLLRLGVALLGLRISVDVLAALGWQVAVFVILGVLSTIGFGLAVSRLFGFRFRFAFLSAGAVAICGASAAMAIAAILPRDDRSEERLIFTVVGVTLLSTLAMILYPVLGATLGFDDRTIGIFIGATVHDVAQVVGAGFSVSDEAGNIATVVKLLRVLMLAPIVLVGAIAIRALTSKEDADGGRPPLVPAFVLGFLGLAALNSAGVFPVVVTDLAGETSRWLLLIAIASVGLKTVPQDILKVGLPAVGLIVAETAFLAMFILVGIFVLGGMAAP